MKLNTQSIGFYIEKLKNKEYYSFPGFSDAEWICMDEPKIGERTGGHQTYTRKIGDELKEALLAHQDDPSYMKAIPDCIINPTWYGIERMIKNMVDAIVKTAYMDGKDVPIYIEKEPASGGKNQVAAIAMIPELTGFTVKAHDPRSMGDKVMRSQPWFAKAEAGLVYLVRGSWNSAFLNQFVYS